MARENYNDLIAFLTVAREGSLPAQRLRWGSPSRHSVTPFVAWRSALVFAYSLALPAASR